MKSFIKKNKLTALILLLSVIGVVILSVVGGVLAKYITEKRLSGKINVSGQLAVSIEIVEHNIDRLPSGEIVLDTTKERTHNEYPLMPGVDVAKDPFVRVTGFSGADSWLYVEVVKSSGFPDTITFEIDSGWTKLDGVSGREIYYKALGASDAGDVTANILKDQKLIVSDQLARETRATLSFNAYIAQKSAADSTAAADFNNLSDKWATASSTISTSTNGGN